MAEVEKHASRESAWFVHSGHVYDATKFLADHPGGAESILIVAGQARQLSLRLPFQMPVVLLMRLMQLMERCTSARVVLVHSQEAVFHTGQLSGFYLPIALRRRPRTSLTPSTPRGPRAC